MDKMKINIHDRENNSESEGFLVENKPHFSRQCEKVLELLKRGERLTVRTAILNHGISSLPRRILDLKESGVEIQFRWISDQEGSRKFKEWFIPKTTEIGVFEKQGNLFG